MTYEEAKKLIARAEELAQAVKDGKTVILDGLDEKTSSKTAEQFFLNLTRNCAYTIAQPKTRRPWTQEEAEAHLGWVLVAPDGSKSLITSAVNLGQNYSWQVHPVGHPDQRKPAYVEE